MKNFIILMIVFISILFSVGVSSAKCWYNGKAYSKGAVVGNYKCTSSGQWVRR